MPESIPILLIHGFAGGVWDYHPVQKYLRKKGRPVEFFEFTYKKRHGQVALQAIADELKGYIDANLKDREFYAIGFSQGGIIWRTCALRHPELQKQVSAAFTISTPHSGSLFAYFGMGDGIADLRPNSDLLKKLDAYEDSIPYYAVYNPFDSFVVPGSSGFLKRAKVNVRVPSWTHMSTFGEKKTLELIDSVVFGR